MKITLRNVLGWCLACFLIAVGLVRRAKRRALAGEFILSVYYHNPTPEEFAFCVRWFKKNGFQFLSLADVEQLARGKKTMPKGGVVLTVDDGWALNKDAVVKTAEQYQVPVAIFVSTEPVEEGVFWWSYVMEAHKQSLVRLSKEELKRVVNESRKATVEELKKKISLPREALTIEQVKEIAASPFVTIGSHTLSHPILPSCNEEQAYDELYLSKLKLEQWINKEVNFFAYPNGDYSAREMAILSEANYSLAFSTEPRYLTAQCLQSKYQLPRFEVNPGVSHAENLCRMMGVWQRFMQRLAVVSAFFSARATRSAAGKKRDAKVYAPAS